MPYDSWLFSALARIPKNFSASSDTPTSDCPTLLPFSSIRFCHYSLHRRCHTCSQGIQNVDSYTGSSPIVGLLSEITIKKNQMKLKADSITVEADAEAMVYGMVWKFYFDF